MRPTLRHVLLLAPLALLAPTARAATPAAAAAPAAPATGTLQLGKGDVVTIDLSKLPARVSRRGTATCVALVAVPDQRPQEKRCDQPFAFEVPLAGPPIVMIFTPDKGAPERLELPLARAAEPRLFTSPGVGTFAQAPVAASGKGGTTEEQSLARAAATQACRGCTGSAEFRLREWTVADAPPAALDMGLTVKRVSKP